MRRSIRYGVVVIVAAIAATKGPAMAEQQTSSSPSAEPSTSVQAPSRFGGHVQALAVNPQTGTLFLGARTIYRSADGGKSWEAIDGIPKSEERVNITSIAIDPSDPQVMYATGNSVGVIKSTNGGQTWNAASTGLGSMSTEGFAIDAKDPNTLYVWALGTGLYRSKDAGKSWQWVDDGPISQEIRTLISVDLPTGMGGIWLYAGLDAGVTKSPDCFCGWDRLPNAGLPEGRVYGLTVGPSDPDVLYAGLRRGVFKSTDGGQSWAQVTDLVEDAALAVNAAKPSEIYAVGSTGTLVFSPDAGATWKKMEVTDDRG